MNKKVTFDDIKKIDENGIEYWEARELQSVLEYIEWRNFVKVISQAQISCKVSQNDVQNHFVEVNKMVDIGSMAKRNQLDYKLTRYACYLIVMNADPRKAIIATGQTYFAVKTRQQELEELYDRLNEDEKRLFLRSDIKQRNMLLVDVAKKHNVETNLEYAEFQNAGYKGLYGGLTADNIAELKKLNSGNEILDYMNSEELAANLFRITQTQGLLEKKEGLAKAEAGNIHYTVGKEVREAIQRIGGTMPENQPVPQKGIRTLQKEKIARIKNPTQLHIDDDLER